MFDCKRSSHLLDIPGHPPNEFELLGRAAERPPFGYAQDMPSWTGWFPQVIEKIQLM